MAKPVKNNIVIDKELSAKMLRLRAIGEKNNIPSKTTQQNVDFAYEMIERLQKFDDVAFKKITGLKK